LPFAHWLLAAHTCHDATHGSLSSDPKINYWAQFTAHPIFFNVFVWIPQHLISHHQYTNDALLDVDVHHFAPAVLSSSLKAENPEDKNAAWAFVVKGCLTTIGTCVLQPMRTILDSKTTSFDCNITPVSEGVSKTAVAISMLPSLAVMAYPFLHHFSTAQDESLAALAFLFLWPWIGSSLIWTTMTQTSHVQESCQAQEGDSNCWTAAQVAASLDYSVTGGTFERSLVAGLTGGLNMQALHHALPSISQVHMAAIYNDFADICDKRGARRATSKNLATAASECLDFVFETNRPLPNEVLSTTKT